MICLNGGPEFSFLELAELGKGYHSYVAAVSLSNRLTIVFTAIQNILHNLEENYI